MVGPVGDLPVHPDEPRGQVLVSALGREPGTGEAVEDGRSGIGHVPSTRPAAAAVRGTGDDRHIGDVRPAGGSAVPRAPITQTVDVPRSGV